MIHSTHFPISLNKILTQKLIHDKFVHKTENAVTTTDQPQKLRHFLQFPNPKRSVIESAFGVSGTDGKMEGGLVD